jgi:HSF-type DNA-binding
MHCAEAASKDEGQTGSPSATFPQKLFSMLQLNIDQGEVIHWLPHGLAFKVVDNEKFSEGVLPKYFKRESSLALFVDYVLQVAYLI